MLKMFLFVLLVGRKEGGRGMKSIETARLYSKRKGGWRVEGK